MVLFSPFVILLQIFVNTSSCSPFCCFLHIVCRCLIKVWFAYLRDLHIFFLSYLFIISIWLWSLIALILFLLFGLSFYGQGGFFSRHLLDFDKVKMNRLKNTHKNVTNLHHKQTTVTFFKTLVTAVGLMITMSLFYRDSSSLLKRETCEEALSPAAASVYLVSSFDCSCLVPGKLTLPTLDLNIRVMKS